MRLVWVFVVGKRPSFVLVIRMFLGCGLCSLIVVSVDSGKHAVSDSSVVPDY